MKKIQKKYIICAAVILVLAVILAMVFLLENHAPQQTVTDSAVSPSPSAAEVTDEPQQIAPSEPTVSPEPSAVIDKAPATQPTDKQPPLQSEQPSAIKEAPSSTQQPQEKEKALTCTLSVRCDNLLNNMDKLADEKKALVPRDGVIFAPQTVTFYEGETVFNVLQREMKKHRIHMEFVMAPVYRSAYIEGIANLYEFDCGGLSGWVYRVNGITPRYGCSLYTLHDGDAVEWVYTCDLGRDANGYTGE